MPLVTIGEVAKILRPIMDASEAARAWCDTLTDPDQKALFTELFDGVGRRQAMIVAGLNGDSQRLGQWVVDDTRQFPVLLACAHRLAFSIADSAARNVVAAAMTKARKPRATAARKTRKR